MVAPYESLFEDVGGKPSVMVNYWLWSNPFFLVASRFNRDGLRPQ